VLVVVRWEARGGKGVAEVGGSLLSTDLCIGIIDVRDDGGRPRTICSHKDVILTLKS